MATTTTDRQAAATNYIANKGGPYFAYIRPQALRCRRTLKALQDAVIDGRPLAAHLRKALRQLDELDKRCMQSHRMSRTLVCAASRSHPRYAAEDHAIALYEGVK